MRGPGLGSKPGPEETSVHAHDASFPRHCHQSGSCVTLAGPVLASTGLAIARAVYLVDPSSSQLPISSFTCRLSLLDRCHRHVLDRHFPRPSGRTLPAAPRFVIARCAQHPALTPLGCLLFATVQLKPTLHAYSLGEARNLLRRLHHQHPPPHPRLRTFSDPISASSPLPPNPPAGAILH